MPQVFFCSFWMYSQYSSVFWSSKTFTSTKTSSSVIPLWQNLKQIRLFSWSWHCVLVLHHCNYIPVNIISDTHKHTFSSISSYKTIDGSNCCHCWELTYFIIVYGLCYMGCRQNKDPRCWCQQRQRSVVNHSNWSSAYDFFCLWTFLFKNTHCLDIIISPKSLWNKHTADVLYLYVKKFYSYM